MMRPTRMSLQSPPIRNLAATLVLATVLTVPALADSASLCESAMFTCQQKAGGSSTHGKNLKVLLKEGRSVRWVLRRCGGPIDRHPFRCDWKRTMRAGKVASKATTRSKSPTARTRPAPARPSRTSKSSAADAPRRGANGRYGTVPAPTQVPTVTAADMGPFAVEIKRAAQRYKLPPDLIRAVMKVESGYNPGATSVKGALGLMQLMPTTATAMGVKDPRDPQQNIMGGARFLRVLANRFGGDLVKVLSAYHAGSTRVKRRGATPFAKTDSYVRKVLGVYYALRDRR